MIVSRRSDRWLPRAAFGFVVALTAGLLLVPQVALATPGARLWLARYNSPGNGSDFSYGTAISPDGSRVFVAGGSGDFRTVAYDAATGAKQWVGTYAGPGTGQEYAYAIGVSPDGTRVYVTGKSNDHLEFEDYATVAFDASDGHRLWASRYTGPAFNSRDVPHALGVSPDGTKVFVTGTTLGPGSYDYGTVAYDASNGNKLWDTLYDGPGASTDIATGLGVSPDGTKVYVTGNSKGASSLEDYATIAYDTSTGHQLWAMRYNGPANGVDEAEALVVSPNGSRVFTTGLSAGDTTGLDYATVAYSASGVQQWAKRYTGGDSAAALAVSPDGSSLFVTGLSSTSDIGTIAYATANGAKLWAKNYDGTGQSDFGTAVTVVPGGSVVVVTGSSEGSTGVADYATVAYSTSAGAKLWAKRYNGPAHDRDVPSAVVPSPDGSRVFVGGYSWSNAGLGGFDYATIAYSIT